MGSTPLTSASMNICTTLLAHDEQGRHRIMDGGPVRVVCAGCQRDFDDDGTSSRRVRLRFNQRICPALVRCCIPCASTVGFKNHYAVKTKAIRICSTKH